MKTIKNLKFLRFFLFLFVFSSFFFFFSEKTIASSCTGFKIIADGKEGTTIVARANSGLKFELNINDYSSHNNELQACTGSSQNGSQICTGGQLNVKFSPTDKISGSQGVKFLGSGNVEIIEPADNNNYDTFEKDGTHYFYLLNKDKIVLCSNSYSIDSQPYNICNLTVSTSPNSEGKTLVPNEAVFIQGTSADSGEYVCNANGQAGGYYQAVIVGRNETKLATPITQFIHPNCKTHAFPFVTMTGAGLPEGEYRTYIQYETLNSFEYRILTQCITDFTISKSGGKAGDTNADTIGFGYCNVLKNEADKNKCISCLQEYNGSGSWTALGCIPAGDMTAFIKWLLERIIPFAGGIAFLLMAFGAFQILTSSGDPKKVQAGQELITSALSGLLFIILALFLLKLIGVDILKIPQFGG